MAQSLFNHSIFSHSFSLCASESSIHLAFLGLHSSQCLRHRSHTSDQSLLYYLFPHAIVFLSELNINWLKVIIMYKYGRIIKFILSSHSFYWPPLSCAWKEKKQKLQGKKIFSPLNFDPLDFDLIFLDLKGNLIWAGDGFLEMKTWFQYLLTKL